MKTNKLLIIATLLICMNNSFARSGGGDGDGGGGPKITKGILSRILGDGSGGGGPKPTKETLVISFGDENIKAPSLLIEGVNNNYILESMTTEEVEYFLENYLTNEDVLDIRRF